MKNLPAGALIKDARDKTSRWMRGAWLLAVAVGILVCSKGCTSRVSLGELRLQRQVLPAPPGVMNQELLLPLQTNMQRTQIRVIRGRCV